MKIRPPAGLAAGLLALSLVAAAPAGAAPVTVTLRVEGPTRTLFEGPVTTDVAPFAFTGEAGHVCDGSAPAGTATTPQVTRGAVLSAAAASTSLVLRGTWSDMFGSPSFTEIGGESVAYDAATNRYLVEYQNNQSAAAGACGSVVNPGDQVLFAYAVGTETLLALRGPTTAAPGQAVTLTVSDAATGAPVAGADVEGRQSGADGTVVAGPYAARGNHDAKATKAGAIRSNRVRICVTDGADGACGTTPAASAPAPSSSRGPDRGAPGARLAGVREKQVFRKGRGPRVLRGTVPADPSGLRAVKLRLTRRARGRCEYFSGRSERFVRTRCGRSFPFAVGTAREVSYLLPKRLGPGRYVLDLIAVDGAGNRDRPKRGSTRVVFTVR
jgi:hypothetical protein